MTIRSPPDIRYDSREASEGTRTARTQETEDGGRERARVRGYTGGDCAGETERENELLGEVAIWCTITWDQRTINSLWSGEPVAATDRLPSQDSRAHTLSGERDAEQEGEDVRQAARVDKRASGSRDRDPRSLSLPPSSLPPSFFSPSLLFSLSPSTPSAVCVCVCVWTGRREIGSRD